MIRPFKDTDFAELMVWWKKAQEPFPSLDHLLRARTFVWENCFGQIVASISLILFETGDIGLIDYLISDPEVQKSLRRIAVEDLVQIVQTEALKLKCKRLIGLTKLEALAARYQELGFERFPQNFICVSKSL